MHRTLPLTLSCAFLAAPSHSLLMAIMNAPSALLQPAEVGPLQLLGSCTTVHVYSLNEPTCAACTGLDPMAKLVEPWAQFLQ